MTKCCRRGIVFLYADSSAIPPLFVRGIQFLHTLESGNPQAIVRNVGPVFLRKRRKEIPAFAGMTRISGAFRFPHTLFRGTNMSGQRQAGSNRGARSSRRRFALPPEVEPRPDKIRALRRGRILAHGVAAGRFRGRYRRNEGFRFGAAAPDPSAMGGNPRRTGRRNCR